jgi:hypothetical protein
MDNEEDRLIGMDNVVIPYEGQSLWGDLEDIIKKNFVPKIDTAPEQFIKGIVKHKKGRRWIEKRTSQ